MRNGRFTELNETTDNMKAAVATMVNADIERVNKMAVDIQEKMSSEVENGFSTIKTQLAGIDDKFLQSLRERFFGLRGACVIARLLKKAM